MIYKVTKNGWNVRLRLAKKKLENPVLTIYTEKSFSIIFLVDKNLKNGGLEIEDDKRIVVKVRAWSMMEGLYTIIT
jgi:hypothetical protein